MQWKRHTPLQLLKTEIEVYSLKYEYAGKKHDLQLNEKEHKHKRDFGKKRKERDHKERERENQSVDMLTNSTHVFIVCRILSSGTMDALASLKSENKTHLVALDWKTTNAFWPEFALQIAAYAKAYEEVYGEHIDQAYLVLNCLSLSLSLSV